MKRKTLMALGLAAAMVAASLAGCGSDDSASTSGDSSASESDGTDEGSSGGETLSIFVYGNEQEQAIYTNMIKEFEEANNCTVETQYSTQDDYGTTLTGMMTARDLPDVFYVGPESVSQYVDNGYILDLTPVLEEAGLSTDGLMQDILDSYRYDGESTGQGDLYGLPHDASVFAYAYNKELFDEAGLDYPDPDNPYTYEEFVEVCKQLTKDTDGDGEIDQWGMGAANVYMLYQYVWSNGASFLSDDYRTVTIDTDEFIDACQKYVDLTLEYGVTPSVEQDASLGVYQRWLAGQEAFYACGTWDVAAFMDDETFPFEWDLCAYPTLSSGVSMTWCGTVGYCVAADTENQELATKLAYFMSADEDGNRELSGITTGESIQLPNVVSMAEGEFKEAVDSGDLPFPSNVDVFFNYLNGTDKYEGKFMETTYTPSAGWCDLFFEGFDNVKNGSMTVEEYVAQVQPEMQELLDEAWEAVE